MEFVEPSSSSFPRFLRHQNWRWLCAENNKTKTSLECPIKTFFVCRWWNYSKLHKLVAFAPSTFMLLWRSSKQTQRLIEANLVYLREANKRSLSSRAHSSPQLRKNKNRPDKTTHQKQKSPHSQKLSKSFFRCLLVCAALWASFWLLLIRRFLALRLLASRTAFFGCELSQPPTFFKNFWSWQWPAFKWLYFVRRPV